MIRTIVVLFLVLFSFGVKSQNSIRGKVLDSLTHEPIPFVNVYFANTTIGTVTNESGEFIIKGIPTGKYIFTISFVGYSTVQIPVDFQNNELNITVKLTQQAIELQEVFVTADSSNRERYLQFFKENFLGRTKNATQLVIMNPRDLRLFYDSEDSVFVAHARKLIEVENRALGYKIYYQLINFQIDFKNNKMDYRGIPRFEQLDPKGPRELKRWESERKRAYYGSFSHFLRSLKQGALGENGFEVNVLTQYPNKKRPSDARIANRIEYFQKRLQVAKGTTINRNEIIDSLNYYSNLFQKPYFLDSVGRKINYAYELFAPGSKDLIGYKGMLRVTYKNESEETNYTIDKLPLKQQQSNIHFLGQTIKIYENGYYEPINDVFLDGYMGWSEKLAELLPQEYTPDQVQP